MDTDNEPVVLSQQAISTFAHLELMVEKAMPHRAEEFGPLLADYKAHNRDPAALREVVNGWMCEPTA